MKTTKTLNDLTTRGADMLIAWVNGTAREDTAQGRAVREMVEDFLSYMEQHQAARAFHESPKPEAASAVAA